MEKAGPQSIVDLNDLTVMDENTEDLRCGLKLYFSPKIPGRQCSLTVCSDGELIAARRIQRALRPQQAVEIPCVRILISVDAILRGLTVWWHDMAREKIYRFRCSECPDCFIYKEAAPKKLAGAVLEFGERYCRGGKRIRVFKRHDPKIYPPSWCPKLKNPAANRYLILCPKHPAQSAGAPSV